MEIIVNNNISFSKKNKKFSRRNFLKTSGGILIAAPYIIKCRGVGNKKISTKKIIKTNSAPEPVGPYSQAVEAGGIVFVSGQIPVDPKTNQLDKGDIKSQARTALQNISAILKSAGLTMEDVVKTTVFLTNLDEFSEMNKVYSEYFSEGKPARSTVQVTRLAFNVKIEIDAIAVKNK